MMMAAGIEVNQAIHRLNATRSKMMRKEEKDSRVTMPLLVKIVKRKVFL